MVFAVILPGALAVSGFAFLRFAVFLLFDLFSWLPVRSLPVGELSFAGPQGLPSLVAARGRLRKASCLSCVGSRSWSLRLWSSSSCWLELPLLLALVVLFFLDFVDFLVLRQLPELRGTRQVERFAACSFRHLPQVVSHPGG